MKRAVPVRYEAKFVKYDARSLWNQVAETDQLNETPFLAGGRDTPLYQYKRRLTLTWFRKIDFVGKKVLEVGCGPGANLLELNNLGARMVVGCDISDKMVELARHNSKTLSDAPQLCVIDGSRLPFKDTSMDITFTMTVLQHVTEDQVLISLIEEICRVTNGHIFLFEDTCNRLLSGEGYVARPVQYYRSMIETHDFRLVETRMALSLAMLVGFLFYRISQISRLQKRVRGSSNATPKSGNSDGILAAIGGSIVQAYNVLQPAKGFACLHFERT
jgi:SAM-dependent methyltransferase